MMTTASKPVSADMRPRPTSSTRRATSDLDILDFEFDDSDDFLPSPLPAKRQGCDESFMEDLDRAIASVDNIRNVFNPRKSKIRRKSVVNKRGPRRKKTTICPYHLPPGTTTIPHFNESGKAVIEAQCLSGYGYAFGNPPNGKIGSRPAKFSVDYDFSVNDFQHVVEDWFPSLNTGQPFKVMIVGKGMRLEQIHPPVPKNLRDRNYKGVVYIQKDTNVETVDVEEPGVVSNDEEQLSSVQEISTIASSDSSGTVSGVLDEPASVVPVHVPRRPTSNVPGPTSTVARATSNVPSRPRATLNDRRTISNVPSRPRTASNDRGATLNVPSRFRAMSNDPRATSVVPSRALSETNVLRAASGVPRADLHVPRSTSNNQRAASNVPRTISNVARAASGMPRAPVASTSTSVIHTSGTFAGQPDSSSSTVSNGTGSVPGSVVVCNTHIPAGRICNACSRSMTSGETCIICRQDAEFFASLEADQHKADEKRAEEAEQKAVEAAKMLQKRKDDERQQQRQQQQTKMREERRTRLKDEPPITDNDTFLLKLRLPEGHMEGSHGRRFRANQPISTLFDFIGSQDNATINFTMQIPGGGIFTVNESDPDLTLRGVGIEAPMVISVFWKHYDEEKPNTETESQNDDDDNIFIDGGTPGGPVQIRVPRANVASLLKNEEDSASQTPRDPSPLAEPRSPTPPRDLSPLPGPRSPTPPRDPSPLPGPRSPTPPRDPSPLPGPQSPTPPSSEQLLKVKRITVVDDMIKIFMNRSRLREHLTFSIIGEEGKDEEGEGVGVSREVFSAFWAEFSLHFCTGCNGKMPRLRVGFHEREWEAVAAIFVKGYVDHGILPLTLSRSFFVGSLFGPGTVSNDLLMSSFEQYVSDHEAGILSKAKLWKLDNDDFDDLVEICSRFGVHELPTETTVSKIILNAAKKELLQRPAFILNIFHKMCREFQDAFPSTLEELMDKLNALKPTTRKVVKLLKSSARNETEQRVFMNLVQLVKELKPTQLAPFLRLVTGSPILSCKEIIVSFFTDDNQGSGLCRVPIFRTCGPLIELPTSYTKFEEMKSEFLGILRAEPVEFDFI